MTDLPVPSLVTPALAPTRGERDARWVPAALRRADIDSAIERLVSGPRVDGDLRRLLVVHPFAPSTSTGLAPGIQVSIEVLTPGERAVVPRTNSSALALQLRGTSTVHVNGATHEVTPRDSYSVPPFGLQAHTATGNDVSVRLVFSNAALLDLLGAHYVEPAGEGRLVDGAQSDDLSVRNDGRVTTLGDGPSWRLEYERVIDPPWVPQRSWFWRWSSVVEELDRMATLGERYNGRRVCVLYDPSTGRTNGTTSSLFASMCVRPAGIVDRAHRHTAAAVNYFFDGEGWSTIAGVRIEWSAGDLVFIAPSWSVHHHASGEHDVYQLAVQDNPLHLAMGSLVWQEDLKEPPRVLGAEPGFETNRDAISPTAAT